MESFHSELTGTHCYFGLKPPRPDAVRFKLGNYLDFPAIKPPRVFGFVTNKMSWGMLGNDHAGDCVVAGAAHETILWSHATRRPSVTFSDQNVLAEYAAASGWNGVPNDASDTGLDMELYAKRRRTIGLPDAQGALHKIVAYADVGVDADHVAKATYVFGAIGLGFNLPESALQQFDAKKPWDYVGSHIAGGHYTPCVGRNRAGNLLVVTWGVLQAVTVAFLTHYLDTAIAYISPEFLDASGETPRHFDRAALDANLSGLAT